MAKSKKGQLAIFVILALVIVGSIVLFFVFRDELTGQSVPRELAPVFDRYSECISLETRTALQFAGTQGGYVEVPDYAPGSEYAPSSSQLNFLGFPVPYWYYIEANGLIKEQIPSKSEIEQQIENYIEENIANCDFETYYRQGFEINFDSPIVNVEILDNKVEVVVDETVEVAKEEVRGVKNSHDIEVTSRFGAMYKTALEIYDKEKAESFLENYAIDVLRLYAPVDGVELQCGPKVWSTLKVTSDVKDGLEQNLGAVKIGRGYYDITKNEREYFVVDGNIDEPVNFLYSRNWPTKIEVFGDGVDDEIMAAEPVGTQEGLGILGFCYVPYHFVYDLNFPVMIQVYDAEEIFQFPVVVIIDNNAAREPFEGGQLEQGTGDFNLCEFRTEEIEVNLYNANLNSVDGNISFECFDQRCRLGNTLNGRFIGAAPACVNGYVVVKAEGYADMRQLMSTNEEDFVDVILEREYEVELDLLVDGKKVDNNAVVIFSREDGKTRSVALPDVKSVKLSEGYYDVSVYVYSDTGINIPASKEVKCVDVPREGILAFFGGYDEECFDIDIPATSIEYALSGGGKSKEYLLESELSKEKIALNVKSLPKPATLDALQNNFEIFETRRVEVRYG